MKRFATFLIFFLLATLTSKSQYFSTGEDPSSLKWRQIISQNFQLIYPVDFEEKAQQMAHYFEKVYNYGSVTLNHKPRKISIIFHTQTVKSNGLVGWAPRRMELFTPPHQEIYAQDWLEQLALHEFRHVVQVDKITSQVPIIVKALLGEQGVALITGLYLPFWFIEGDAVISETALSTSGRGRLPSFLMEHKAQVVEKGVFSFDKAFNGSYVDFVPNHYKLGYYLTGEIRARYGSEVWDDALNNLARNPLSIVPLNRSLKKRTGMNQRKLYQTVFDSLHQTWLKEDQLYKPEKLSLINEPDKVYTDYRYNYLSENKSIIALKWSYAEISRFVEIDADGREKTLFVPGQIFDESVSYRENLIAWSEFVPDLRFEHSGKSLIKIFNRENSELSTIIPDFKCFAPSISPDKHNIAVVETDFSNHYYLSMYNATTGALIKRYQTPANNYLFSPVWKDNSTLFAILLTPDGKRLAQINPFEEKLTFLYNDDLGELKHLVYKNDHLYFISGYSGKNELYSMNLTSGAIFREVTARFGIEYPAFSDDGKELVLSNYSNSGFQLIKLNTNDFNPVPLNKIRIGVYPLAEALTKQEPGVVDFQNIDTFKYQSKPYRKLTHLINFHSWAPLYFDINTYEVKPGVSFVSQNILGTAETSVGYKWNVQEKAGLFYGKFEYRGWYPIISAEISSGKRASEFYQIQQYTNQSGVVIRQDTIKKRFTWEETKASLDVRIPFNLSQGRYFRLIQPELKYDFTHYQHNTSTPTSFANGNFQTMVYRIYNHQLLRQANMDLMPNFGWVVDASYRHSLAADIKVGKMMAASLKTFWPGILKNHGISLYAGYQEKESGMKFNFGDVVRFPRGWLSVNNNNLFSIAADYKLPLFYPDWNLGSLIYIRRVKAALFYDYAKFNGNIYSKGEITGTFNKSISTAGFELTADSNFLRLYAPANIGFRFNYLPENKNINLEFLLSVDFNSF